MTTIFIEQQPDGDFRVKLQSPDPIVFKLAIDTLKSFIPVPLRRYDPTTKQWTVVVSAADRVHRWLAYCRANLHAQVEWLDAGEDPEEEWTPPPPRWRPTQDDAFKVLHLLPSAPASVIRASYKALALEFHPDRPGGDTVAMQRINGAFQILSKGLQDARR